MARSIKPITRLARLFSTDDGPLYIMAADGTIVFANDAIHQWLDVEPESIIGRKIVFDEPENSTNRMIARLAPPPDVFFGTPITTSICREISDQELDRAVLIYREVRFMPITLTDSDGDDTSSDSTADVNGTNDGWKSDDKLLAIVATVGNTDLTAPILPSAEASEISRTTRRAMELRERIRRLRLSLAQRRGTEILLGDSAAARLGRQRFDIAVASRACTMIVGPKGSGRRQLAEAIFYESTSATAEPLVPLVCPLLEDRLPTIVAETLDETADAALLLLDIDQLDPNIAIELFQVIEERDPTPRILSTASDFGKTTNGDPSLPVELTAILSTVVIELPRLIDRRDDLPILIQAIVNSAAADIESPLSATEKIPNIDEHSRIPRNQRAGVDDKTLELLIDYDWPGEFIELTDVVTEACLAADGPIIRPKDLSKHFRTTAEATLRPVRPTESIDLDAFIDSIRKELVARAMRVAKGNKAKAARLLGLTRPRLYRYVEQFELEATDEGKTPTDAQKDTTTNEASEETSND